MAAKGATLIATLFKLIYSMTCLEKRQENFPQPSGGIQNIPIIGIDASLLHPPTVGRIDPSRDQVDRISIASDADYH